MPETAPLTPCIRVCRMDPDSGLCAGCARTPEEIAAWPRLSETSRAAIMATLSARPRTAS
ncbi:MAG TPA: DUF1289 domain-containing protein [Gammaproteobacteria bacterium]|nr:DUF1289 domain-containing protein [Gammaproteobacteria bacterium]